MFRVLLACLLACVLVGCGEDAAKSSLETDANGYYCPKCKLKFFTEHAVWAEHCPSCKEGYIPQVVGFVCEQQHYTLVAGAKSVTCEKCGKHATALKLPQKADLTAWGAALKSKAEVCSSQ